MIEDRYADIKAGQDFWLYLLFWSEISDVQRWRKRKRRKR